VRTVVLCCVAVALSAAVLAADDHSVIFDEDVDYKAFKTFTIGSGRMDSQRPELKFPAVLSAISDSIRATLLENRLKETSNKSDLIIEFSVKGVDFVIGSFGRPNPVGRGRGRTGAFGTSATVDFTEATLVVDMKRSSNRELVWRGVYHDSEANAGKLATALPNDAKTLVAKYPPKK
jgi:hypothetical protein